MVTLCIRLGALALAACSCVAGATGIVVPAGATLDLNGSAIGLASGDVRLDGQLNLGSGKIIDITAFRLGTTGAASLSSGLLQLVGDWQNLGFVDAGSSQVQFRDGGFNSSVLGTTTFANLSFVSAVGKRYALQSGLTQSATGLLEIHGTPGLPIQIASTIAASAAFLDLLPTGSQSISNVGVSDVHATGQHLAPTLQNEGGSGNDSGWFGGGAGIVAIPAPALSPFGLMFLLLAMVALALRAHFSFNRRH
ncbi:MAG: hypothetical protein ABI411_03255 [Tahibacter sp.]